MSDESTQICGSSKPGPKPDEYRALVRKMMSEMSDRAFDTFWSAMRDLQTIDGEDACLAAIRASTRPNGSLNVSKLRQLADSAVVRAVMEGRV